MASATGRPSTMRAVVLTEPGDLDRYVYREDVAVPEPGPGEVLVAVEACSVNNTDVNVRAGWYEGEIDESGLAFPRIQGADVAGRIAEAGPGVDPSRVGERVICDPSLPGTTESRPAAAPPLLLLGFDADGGYAEYVVVPAASAWRVPEDLPAAELAAYPVAYSTALEMVLRARVRPGETMIVTGASGGVGVAAVQLGVLFGATVVAIASAGKAPQLRELGADVVVDRASPDLAAALRDAGVGVVDVVCDVVGGALLATLVGVVRPGGRCVTAGAIGGPICPVDLRHLIYGDVELHGVARTPPETFAMLVDLIAARRLRAPVARTYPLRELVAAQQAFIDKAHVGKIVVLVAEGAP